MDFSSWVDLTLTGHNYDRNRTYVIHTVQKTPQRTFKDAEYYHTVALGHDHFEKRWAFLLLLFSFASFLTSFLPLPLGKKKKSIPVIEGVTMELVIAQYWSSLGASEVTFGLSFHGIVPQPRQLCLVGGDVIARVDLTTPLRAEEVHPAASLEILRKPIRPAEFQIRPLHERDVLIDGRQSYEMILVYNFKFPEGAVELSPRAPVLNDLLYENPYESQLWMIFDQYKRHLATGDVFAEKVKLSKGSYTLRLQVRHDSIEMLEKLQDMVLNLDFKLKDKVTLSCHPDITSSRTEKGQFNTKPNQKTKSDKKSEIFYSD